MVALSALVVGCYLICSVVSHECPWSHFLQAHSCVWPAPYTTTPTPPVSCPTLWKRYRNSCYYYEIAPLMFEHAEARCQARGATMFVADSVEEWVDVLRMSSPNTLTWVGLIQDVTDIQPKWVAPGGMSYTHINWLDKYTYVETNDFISSKKCVAHVNSYNKYALFYDCAMTFASICERNATLLPELWDHPGDYLPKLPNLQDIATLPTLPALPAFPALPALSALPTLPTLPLPTPWTLPTLEGGGLAVPTLPSDLSNLPTESPPTVDHS